MQILQAKNKNDYNEWVSIWSNWKGKEIYAHPDYLSLYGDCSEAMCAILVQNNLTVLFPFSIREIELDVYQDSDEKKFYDIITPYGYGDVYVIGEGDSVTVKTEFHLNFKEWASSYGIVSEFVRFNLFSKSVDDYHGEIIHNSDNIVCDLTKGEEQIWKEFKPKIRQNARKALKAEVSIEFDSKGERLDSFLQLYYGTMKRRNALDKYYFKKEFFEMIHKKLKGHFIYFYATHNGIDVSVELILISDENIYSFLVASDEASFHLHPNELLKNEIIKWGISKGKKNYVIGGGYGKNDGLFSFKKDFSPTGILPYYVGKKIYNHDVHDKLVVSSGVEILDDANFFPLYRKGMISELI
ncbi:GNAT family N-acetyltransferase [Ancylomarina sp. 16SWW S1-10-2]|uniref:GNAT family N-acetyltransferase n=1 Tax=Ancylomarina sp. 16SWW S1-10-2 TaxID=2499681 RepID=UPI0012AEAC07|nr:GNAT family N-acetyltransferase [Ancylomarina sp. 16SWW S1-10-2]MRT93453.1 GNAT family N-acetyltransferase [Ancylomarina sp. 16SWW S1-10-2]